MATKYSGQAEICKSPSSQTSTPVFVVLVDTLIHVWILLYFILAFVNEIRPEHYQILTTKAVSSWGKSILNSEPAQTFLPCAPIQLWEGNSIVGQVMKEKVTARLAQEAGTEPSEEWTALIFSREGQRDVLPRDN